MEMAAKVQAAAKQLGYDVNPIISDVLGIPHFKGMRIQGSGGEYTILVGDPRVD